MSGGRFRVSCKQFAVSGGRFAGGGERIAAGVSRVTVRVGAEIVGKSRQRRRSGVRRQRVDGKHRPGVCRLAVGRAQQFSHLERQRRVAVPEARRHERGIVATIGQPGRAEAPCERLGGFARESVSEGDGGGAVAFRHGGSQQLQAHRAVSRLDVEHGRPGTLCGPKVAAHHGLVGQGAQPLGE